MTRLHRLAVTALCLCALAVLCCHGVAARFSDSRSLFLNAFEVVDINSTSLRELHESAHMCPWILVAYLDSCGHCRHAAPLVARVAEETLEDSGDVLNEVTVAALNCGTSIHECRELRVPSVPSFYFLFPSDMPVNATTLEPVVANKNLLDKGNVEAKPIMMTRALIGQGANPSVHFDTARKMWMDASSNLWGATRKELCLHMRTYLRNSKESAAAGAGAGGVVLPADSTANFVEETTFHVVDVANAFFETVFREVALKGLESAARRRALFRFLRLVQQRLPGLGADVLLYYMTVNRRVDDAQSSVADFASSVGDWQKLVLSAGIPYQGTPRYLSWRTCKGSSWRYRGFPCGMWLLYHSLTVNAAHVDADDNNTEVLFIILDYARHFFACDSCLKHFLRFQPGDTDPVLQLWRFHNQVNRRLASREGGDPLVPKRIFPTVEQCPACIRKDVTGKEEDRFVETEVSKYLRSRYRWNPVALHEGTVKVTESTTKRSINDDGGDMNAYYNLLSMDTFLTIVLVIVAAVLVMVYILRRHHSSASKRRRPILPLRARD